MQEPIYNLRYWKKDDGTILVQVTRSKLDPPPEDSWEDTNVIFEPMTEPAIVQ